MWAQLASLLTAPLIEGAIGAYKAKLEAGNTKGRIAADLAARELAVQQAEVEAQKQIRLAQVGKWWTVENLAGYIMITYMGKVYLWDAALHLGSTDTVKGDVGTWGLWVMAFFFGKRTIESVIRIAKS